ncbi:MAG: hypothetical protein KAS15_04675 [Nanoarchaeota archaeon]|nr:hypothetical protein [Nanoarchaeota archaeon]
MLQYFLPAILVLGVITSYQDIKIGKIRNKWTIMALAYAFVAYIGLIIHTYFTVGIRAHYIIELVTNMLFAIGVGFGVWYFGIWTAGDGKLFIAFSALIPLSSYSLGYQEWIPSITLLINIFVPASLMLIIFILFKIRIIYIKDVLKSFSKEFFQPRQLLNSAIYLFAILWIMQILLSSIGLGSSYFLRFILTLGAFAAIQKKFGNKTLYIMLAISLARLAIDKSIYSVSFLIDLLLLLFIWIFIRSFLTGSTNKLAQEIFAQDIDINKLKPGMVLSEIIEKKGKINEEELNTLKKQAGTEIIKYKEEYYIKNRKSSITQNNYIDEEAEGLTTRQISKIRELGFKTIRVSQTMPFAPLIFLGVILTIIAKGNILILIQKLVY